MPPSDVYVRSFYTLIKLLHKSPGWSSLISGPRLNSSLPEAKNPSVFLWASNNHSTVSYQFFRVSGVPPPFYIFLVLHVGSWPMVGVSLNKMIDLAVSSNMKSNSLPRNWTWEAWMRTRNPSHQTSKGKRLEVIFPWIFATSEKWFYHGGRNCKFRYKIYY